MSPGSANHGPGSSDLDQPDTGPVATARRDDQVEPTIEPAGSASAVTIVAHDVGSVGGMERQLVELAIGLRRQGHEVTVIARTCVMPAGTGVVFHRVRGPARPFLVAYPWFMVAGSLALRRWRRGIVQATGAILLDPVDVIAVHYCHQVGTVTPSRATRLFRAYINVVARVNRIVERVCYRANRSATFVCVSEGVADEMRTYFPDAAERVVTIQNGVDTEWFAPKARREEAAEWRARLGIGRERLVAAFVGSEWERKGLAALVRALPSAPDWDLVVAGGGDREHYENLARSLGVQESVHWLGVTRDVQLVYQLADALVFPSSYEAFSLVTLEAAASGLPILATAINGVRELVQDGENGFLITQEPAVIAQRLEQLAADPALRERMGQAARRSALGFRWERMVARHHDLYSSLAGELRS